MFDLNKRDGHLREVVTFLYKKLVHGYVFHIL